MKTIKFYRLPSGKSPVEDFLDSLSAKEAQKVVWVLSLIEEMNSISTKFYKKLSGCADIVEARAQIGKNNFRLLGFEHRDTLVILTNGFKKQEQKVPKSEIALAEQRKNEYLSRGDQNG